MQMKTLQFFDGCKRLYLYCGKDILCRFKAQFGGCYELLFVIICGDGRTQELILLGAAPWAAECG